MKYIISVLGSFLIIFSASVDASFSVAPNTKEPPRPSQQQTDDISRLSEKYIMETITEDELETLKKYGADFGQLDIYKSDYQKREAEKIQYVDQETNTQSGEINPDSDESYGTGIIAQKEDNNSQEYNERETTKMRYIEEERTENGKKDTSAKSYIWIFILSISVINFIILIYILLKNRKQKNLNEN